MSVRWLVVCAYLSVTLTACGYKGALKTPAQIEAEAAKKAKKEAQ